MDFSFHTTLLILLMLLSAGAEAEPRNCTTASRRCFDVRVNPGQPCLVFRQWLACLRGTRDVCQLEESRVTFDQLVRLAAEACDALGPLSPNLQPCPSLGTCVSRTATATAFNLTDPGLDRDKQQQAIDRSVIRASFWCRFMEENMECYVSNAQPCSFDNENVKAVQGHIDKVKATCNTNDAATLTAALMVYAAAMLVHWTRH